ncbi:MAG: nickel pincer cofactor biosynthesis protein LarC [Bacteroidales bacterium]|nr:nickel pincer cofactor biosynthesis protein LarC [Bacteroidales bacterium]
MKILYYDCFAGISGDMNLGALLDLGVDEDHLRKELAKLPIEGYELRILKDMRKGISGTKIEVQTEHLPEHHSDHKGIRHDVADHLKHKHEREHHHNRTFSEIKQMINTSRLTKDIKNLSISIFEKVATAEAKIHNKPVDEVHFHEVGAIDSIIDIVGAAICIRALAPDKIMASTVELGSGTIRCMHGIYPVPAPATAEILKEIPVRKGTVPFEATTPTGAAILANCVDRFTDNLSMKILKTGYGIGHKDSDIPNVLRVFWCETADGSNQEVIISDIIECNIDDMNPEYYDFIIDALFEAGAKDVYITPIIMKKSRPAVTLSVLAEADSWQRVKEVLFTETSTLGIRKYSVEKTMLKRKMEFLDTTYGRVRIKTAYFNRKKIKSKPEYEDCMKIARENKIPLNQVYKEIERLLSQDEAE